MIPCAACLADFSALLLLFSLREKKKEYWPIFIFCGMLFFWNASVAILFLSKSEAEAKLVLYVIHHLLPLFPLAFLWSAVKFSGRRWGIVVHIANSMSIIVLLMLEYSFWLTPDDTFFISDIKKHDWGYYPLIGTGTACFSVQVLYCLIAGMIYYFRPVAATTLMKVTRTFFILSWLGMSTNYLPAIGLDIFPLGSATDAIIFAFMTAVLFKQQFLWPRSAFYLRLSGAAAAIAVALIFSWIFTELITVSNRFLSLALTVSSALIAIYFFQRFFRPRSPIFEMQADASDTPLFSLLQTQYSLTYNETTICALLADGFSRNEICIKMNISTNTLKTHLSSIYRKTIDRQAVFVSIAKDKLQRLTVFLHKIKKYQAN